MTGLVAGGGPAPVAGSHQALLYEEVDELVGILLPFVTEGLQRGEGVMAIASGENLRALRSALPSGESVIQLVDSVDWYSKPVEVLARYIGFIDQEIAEGRPGVRIVGEIPWLRLGDRKVREWMRYEAVIGSILDAYAATIVCTHRTTVLPPALIDLAMATHPIVIRGGTATPSDRFVPPERLIERWRATLEVPLGVDGRRFDPVDAVSAGVYLTRRATDAGLMDAAVQDLVAAATQVMANPPVADWDAILVSAWPVEGEFICQIDGEVPWAAEPLAGYTPPVDDSRTGWALLMARHIAQTLEIGNGARGAAVRLSVPHVS